MTLSTISRPSVLLFDRTICATPVRPTRGELFLAGTLANPEGALLVFHTEDRAVAESFARQDPYVVNGLVARWEIRPWTVVIGGTEPPSSALQLG